MNRREYHSIKWTSWKTYMLHSASIVDVKVGGPIYIEIKLSSFWTIGQTNKVFVYELIHLGTFTHCLVFIMLRCRNFEIYDIHKGPRLDLPEFCQNPFAQERDHNDDATQIRELHQVAELRTKGKQNGLTVPPEEQMIILLQPAHGTAPGVSKLRRRACKWRVDVKHDTDHLGRIRSGAYMECNAFVTLGNVKVQKWVWRVAVTRDFDTNCTPKYAGCITKASTRTSSARHASI